jgi:predicted metalloprotease
MRWEDFRRSSNVEDRRGAGGGGMGGLPIGGRGGLSIGTLIILGLVGWALGINPAVLIGGAEMLAPQGPPVASSPSGSAGTTGSGGAPQDRAGRFAAAVLAQTEEVWASVLPAQAGVAYQNPGLVLFSGATRSGCGAAQSAMGPFYCPLDRKLYIDLDFLDDLQRRLRAEGDFAAAYVIAHEVGHHVENLLGILPKVQAQQRQVGEREANALSVSVELMADCFAGVWAHHAEAKWKILEPGDLDEAINAAGAVGDDRLQRASGGAVVPDSFTHGSAEQRARWLATGLKTGSIETCNTFAAARR